MLYDYFAHAWINMRADDVMWAYIEYHPRACRIKSVMLVYGYSSKDVHSHAKVVCVSVCVYEVDPRA